MNEGIIRFEHVSKFYGEKIALNDVSFEIQQGEFVSIIGSSGCGKTTLLRLINALNTPDKGKIYIYGKDISTVNQVELRRSIGYAIQEVGLFPHMTVKNNIEYLPHILGKKRCAGMDLPSTERLMEITGLEPSLAGRYPAELSGGQRQRVGLARALAANPKILLMDEAFASVDEITRRKLQEEIQEIHKTLGITIVFVTHSIKEALILSDRLFVLQDGNILQDGTPEEVCRHPATEFVAELCSQK